MTTWGWILLLIGAVVNFLVPPLYKKAGRELSEKALYVIKIFGMWLVIIGAAMIFIAGGKVDVGAVK